MRLLLWHFRAGLIKIRTSIKPGNLSFCKDQLSDQIETNTDKVITEEHTASDLKELSGVYGYFPKSISPRLLNQKGIFTVHCDASQKIPVKESRLGDGKPNLLILTIKINIAVAHLGLRS